jgi:four helix bundle protein
LKNSDKEGAGKEQRGMGCGLRVTDYRLRVTGYGLRVTGFILIISAMASKITTFEDLIIWQKAQDLAVKIYHIADNNKYIQKDFTLIRQLKSAAISISDNIAEGFEYNNNPDFHRFLRIAKGSCGEIRNKVHFIQRLKYIDAKEGSELKDEATQLGRHIGDLIKKVKQRIAESRKTRNS